MLGRSCVEERSKAVRVSGRVSADGRLRTETRGGCKIKRGAPSVHSALAPCFIDASKRYAHTPEARDESQSAVASKKAEWEASVSEGPVASDARDPHSGRSVSRCPRRGRERPRLPADPRDQR